MDFSEKTPFPKDPLFPNPKIGPESKTGRFLSKPEILGVGVFFPLFQFRCPGCMGIKCIGRPQRSPIFGPPGEQSCHGKFRKIGKFLGRNISVIVPEVAASQKFRSPHGLQRKSLSFPISAICTGVVPRHGNHF